MAPTSGWFGIMFSPTDGKMTDADTYLMYIDEETGELHVTDSWSTGMFKPQTDTELGG